MYPDPLLDKAAALLDAMKRQRTRLVIAESCTGGLIAGCITEIAGSSVVFDRGFVTYSNEAKSEILGVPDELLAALGAVSAEVAGAMVAGALARSPAGLALSVTGVSGPGGGSKEKPVGTVFMAVARRGETPAAHRFQFAGDRTGVRLATVDRALDLLLERARPA